MTDWTTWKVVDLRAEAKNRGLPTKGVKAELVQRLIEADAATNSADDSQIEDKAAVDEAEPPVDDGPNEEVADSNAIATETSPAIEKNAIVSTEGGAAVNPASPEPTIENTNAVQPGLNDKPGLPTPGPPIDTAVDLQKRKRRSSTPPPSVKRVRQEDERRADEREDVVDFEIGDISTAAEKAPQNGMADKMDIKEKFKVQEQGDPMEDVTPSSAVVGEATPDALEVSGEEAYAKRVAIAESSKAPSSFSEPRDKELAAGRQDEYVQPVATAESSEPSLPLQAQALIASGEDANAERVATGKPSEVRQHTPPPQEPPHDERRKSDTLQPQKDLHEEEHAPSLPSVHPPTSALYIRELMRPLRPEMVEQYILDLITPSGSEHDSTLIQDFYLDQIRTHAFVVLQSVSAAQRVRAALHNQVWPNESNRKSLFVDFIPPSQVKDWIDREESAPRSKSPRWEVVYEEDGETVVAVHQEIGSDRKPSFSRPPPTGPAAAGPVYPGIEAAPRGPRGGRGGRPPLDNPGTLQTQAHPRLAYAPLDEDVVRRRIDNMRSFYARDPPSDLGKDYHRFTFENADAFVDRGREVFIGIRPPHRQKEHEERLRRDRLGTAGASSVAESRRDDYRPPPRPSVTDEDRFSRNNGSRRPDWPPRSRGYRGGRGSGRFRGEDPYRYRPGY